MAACWRAQARPNILGRDRVAAETRLGRWFLQCALCGEREASARYYRLNRLRQDIEHLCRPCWLTLRRAGGGEWQYFLGVGRFFVLFTILPVLVLALLVGWLALWIF